MPTLDFLDSQFNRSPSPDELATAFPDASLLTIARQRGFGLWLSDDRQRIELDDEVPLWFANAVTFFHADLLSLMQHGFLRDWQRPTEALLQ